MSDSVNNTLITGLTKDYRGAYQLKGTNVLASTIIRKSDDDPFFNPVANLHTGFAADGVLYTSGVPEVGTTAGWFTEAASESRSAVQSFPNNAIVLATKEGISILDLDDSLSMWMIFNRGSYTAYPSTLRNSEQIAVKPQEIFYANGVLSVKLVVLENGVDDDYSASSITSNFNLTIDFTRDTVTLDYAKHLSVISYLDYIMVADGDGFSDRTTVTHGYDSSKIYILCDSGAPPGYPAWKLKRLDVDTGTFVSASEDFGFDETPPYKMIVSTNVVYVFDPNVMFVLSITGGTAGQVLYNKNLYSPDLIPPGYTTGGFDVDSNGDLYYTASIQGPPHYIEFRKWIHASQTSVVLATETQGYVYYFEHRGVGFAGPNRTKPYFYYIKSEGDGLYTHLVKVFDDASTNNLLHTTTLETNTDAMWSYVTIKYTGVDTFTLYAVYWSSGASSEGILRGIRTPENGLTVENVRTYGYDGGYIGQGNTKAEFIHYKNQLVYTTKEFLDPFTDNIIEEYGTPNTGVTTSYDVDNYPQGFVAWSDGITPAYKSFIYGPPLSKGNLTTEEYHIVELVDNYVYVYAKWQSSGG